MFNSEVNQKPNYRQSMRELAHQYLLDLILFYRENGKCTTQSLVSHKTEKDGIYSIECKYIKFTSKNLINPNIVRILTHPNQQLMYIYIMRGHLVAKS